jgi:hypothetical protein
MAGLVAEARRISPNRDLNWVMPPLFSDIVADPNRSLTK